MISAHRLRATSASLAAVLFLGACAGAQRTEAPVQTTAPTAATPAVQPDPDLLRAAERIELSGNELGSMWTFENAPVEQWQVRYGFGPDQEWLDHVRLASVRFGTFCSASFVSPGGLVMTNHHCARSCVEDVSTEASDYVVNGFYAETPEREVVCPNLYLDQLAEIEDVTDRVSAAAAAGATDQEIAEAEAALRAEIEQECEAATEFECQVVTLFYGGQYQLYRYRRYAPVKLVFAPELQAGFYGGDLDNFTYPRYALDVAFVRAYQPDGATAASTPDYFRWNPDGADEGEVVFITGNPGTTSRGFTVSQALYERNLRHPFLVDAFELRRDYLQAWAERGPEEEREVREDIFSIENSLKAYAGQLRGLEDPQLMAGKIRSENEFRDRIRADQALQREYGNVWNRIAALQPRIIELRPKVWLYNPQFFGSPHAILGGTLVTYVRELAKPESERAAQFRGDALERVRTALREQTVDPEMSIPMLAARLELARRYLPETDFLRRSVRAGETSGQAAARIIGGTRIADPAFRESIMEGGVTALDASTDPLLSLLARMSTGLAEASDAWREVTAAETVLESRLAQALFAAYGTDLPPDATFTLRISDGIVAGYPYNGTVAPPFTTFFGMFDRAASFEGEMPYTLPESFARREDQLDKSTFLNMVTTNDITGGNSGSPMIDRDARVVGIAFDGNIQQLPNQFLYDDAAGRTVAVHSAGILEALSSVYQAERIVREILDAADGDDR
ncbi:MAG TPA: S46 family peptidase [Longimicrobiales bacterium]|nr:S46 family peptidase [Longimicrobiales bacterium]